MQYLKFGKKYSTDGIERRHISFVPLQMLVEVDGEYVPVVAVGILNDETDFEVKFLKTSHPYVIETYGSVVDIISDTHLENAINSTKDWIAQTSENRSWSILY